MAFASFRRERPARGERTTYLTRRGTCRSRSDVLHATDFRDARHGAQPGGGGHGHPRRSAPRLGAPQQIRRPEKFDLPGIPHRPAGEIMPPTVGAVTGTRPLRRLSAARTRTQEFGAIQGGRSRLPPRIEGGRFRREPEHPCSRTTIMANTAPQNVSGPIRAGSRRATASSCVPRKQSTGRSLLSRQSRDPIASGPTRRETRETPRRTADRWPLPSATSDGGADRKGSASGSAYGTTWVAGAPPVRIARIELGAWTEPTTIERRLSRASAKAAVSITLRSRAMASSWVNRS